MYIIICVRWVESERRLFVFVFLSWRSGFADWTAPFQWEWFRISTGNTRVSNLICFREKTNCLHFYNMIKLYNVYSVSVKTCISNDCWCFFVFLSFFLTTLLFIEIVQSDAVSTLISGVLAWICALYCDMTLSILICESEDACSRVNSVSPFCGWAAVSFALFALLFFADDLWGATSAVAPPAGMSPPLPAKKFNGYTDESLGI